MQNSFIIQLLGYYKESTEKVYNELYGLNQKFVCNCLEDFGNENPTLYEPLKTIPIYDGVTTLLHIRSDLGREKADLGNVL